VEKANNDPVPFANVVLLKGSEQVLVTTTDFDVKYTLKPISVGTYDVKVNYVGFTPKKVSEIAVDSGRITVVNVTMVKGIEFEEVTLHSQPIIEMDQTEVGTIVYRN
jgi:hypothetical protein